MPNTVPTYANPTEVFLPYGKGKGNVQHRTGHEGPEGEQMYNSTLSLTLALFGEGGQRHAPSALPPAKTRYTVYRAILKH